MLQTLRDHPPALFLSFLMMTVFIYEGAFVGAFVCTPCLVTWSHVKTWRALRVLYRRPANGRLARWTVSPTSSPPAAGPLAQRLNGPLIARSTNEPPPGQPPRARPTPTQPYPHHLKGPGPGPAREGSRWGRGKEGREGEGGREWGLFLFCFPEKRYCGKHLSQRRSGSMP